MISVEIVFSSKFSKGAVEVWDELFRQKISSSRELQVVDCFTGKSILVSEVASNLRKQSAESFTLEFRGGSIGFSVLGGLNMSRLDVINLSGSISEAETWVSVFCDDKNFLQARLYDAEYDRWQNAKDLLTYESAGISHAHLPKISNGLPFPLDRDVVDISSNPGRWALKHGYIEAVGSTMWLSGELVKKLDVNLLELESDGSFYVVSTNGCVKVMACDRCFTSGVGTEANLQNMLREYIFGVVG